jgi:hypothetical protein
VKERRPAVILIKIVWPHRVILRTSLSGGVRNHEADFDMMVVAKLD